MKRALALLPLIVAACGPGSRCPTPHGETVAARPLRCADLLEDAKRFDGQTIDVRGRLEQTMNGARLRLLDPGASGDCGRIAGSGVVLRLAIAKKVERDCTTGMNRKFARIVGTLTVAQDASGALGEVAPIAIVPEEE